MGLPLKIGILSISVSPLEEKVSVACLMLRKSAQALGHKVRIYHDAHFQFVLDHGITKYFYKGKPFITPDVMIIRASVIDNIDIRISTVKYLQLMKIPVVNYYLPIVRAKNKVRTMQILNHHGIPIPKTVVLHNINDLDSAAQQIGFPLILKVAFGTLGIGVSIIETIRSRLVQISFAEVSDVQIKAHFETSDIEDLRHYWSGRPGLVARLLADRGLCEYFRRMEKTFNSFAADSLRKRFLAVDEYLSGDIIFFLDNWISRERNLNNTELLKRLFAARKTLATGNANPKYILHNLAINT